ncbi:MAG: glycosyltransferase family 39 protein [Candidatus Limnocylindrales bacterium]
MPDHAPNAPSSPSPPDLSRSQAALAVAAVLVLLAVLYLVPVLSHDWPLADGGLFYAMIGDIIAVGFALPQTISYQQDIIPFAYPPLVFYLAAGVEELTGLGRADVMRLLPPLFTLVAVGTMYLLASELGPSRRHAALSMALFGALVSVSPAVTALIGGGGLPRSLGLALAILAVWQGVRMFKSGRWRNVALTALFAGLAVTTHPQAGVFLVVALAAAWLTRWRTVRAAVQLAIAAAASLLVVGPWLAVVISRHGIDPFISAMAVPDRDLLASLLAYVFLFFTLAPFIAVLDIVGQVQQLTARRPHLLVWRLGVFVFDIRFSPIAAAAPASMLAAHGVLDAVVPATWQLLGRGGRTVSGEARARARQAIVALVLGLALLPTLWQAVELTGPDAALSAEQRAAMTWIADNTETEVITVTLASDDWGSDDLSEWFPALSERRTATAAQGLEWIAQTRDAHQAAEDRLATCRQGPDPAACVAAWIELELAAEAVVVYVDHATDPALVPALIEEQGYEPLWTEAVGTVLEPA